VAARWPGQGVSAGRAAATMWNKMTLAAVGAPARIRTSLRHSSTTARLPSPDRDHGGDPSGRPQGGKRTELVAAYAKEQRLWRHRYREGGALGDRSSRVCCRPAVPFSDALHLPADGRTHLSDVPHPLEALWRTDLERSASRGLGARESRNQHGDVAHLREGVTRRRSGSAAVVRRLGIDWKAIEGAPSPKRVDHGVGVGGQRRFVPAWVDRPAPHGVVCSWASVR
jgi:hypothetical protein